MNNLQGDKHIAYKEGLIGLRMPVMGHGELYNRVSDEWKKTGETESINVSAFLFFLSDRDFTNKGSSS